MVQFLRPLVFLLLSAFVWLGAIPKAEAQELDPDLYLELVEVFPAKSGDDWVYVGDGQITLKPASDAYEADYFWNSPPKKIESSGFAITLTVKATGKTWELSTGIEAHTDGSAFTFDPSPASATVEVLAGEKKSNSVTAVIKPAAIPEGMTVYLAIGATTGSQVVYSYRVMSKSGGGGGQAQIAASIDDCPADIVISAYPPLNCHITISGFRKNTADEVEVILPDRIDTFGNHTNGIQVVAGPGSQQVFIMDDPYSWGIFIFACPSQEQAGMNCYDNVTTPGAVTVPIIVRQKGAGEVQLNLTLNAIPRGGSGGGTGQTARLGNRQRAGDFINIEAGSLTAGPIKFDWQSALWELQPVSGSEFVRIKSAWNPEIFLHIENGALEASTIENGWESAMWKLTPVAGTRYFRIQNRSSESQSIHMHGGVLEAGPIEEKWWSAMWWLQD